MASVHLGPLSVRQARPQDIPALTDLFERAFSRSMSEAKWRWKLGEQTQGPANVFVAERDGQIVGQYAGIVTDYRGPSGACRGIVSVDTMTCPQHRRQGVLTALGTHAVQAWRTAGFEFVIGMPNANFGSRASNMGWTPLTTLINVIRPLSPIALAAEKLGCPAGPRQPALAHSASWAHGRVAKWSTLPGISIGPWHPERELPDLQARYAQALQTHRDIGWLRWRFSSKSELDYRVFTATHAGRTVAWAVLRAPSTLDPDIAALAELIHSPGHEPAARALVHHCASVAAELGATKLQSLVQAHSVTADQLKRWGFWFSREELSVKVIALSPANSKWSQDPSLWALQASDFDIQ